MNLAAQLRAKAQNAWPGAAVAGRGPKHVLHEHPSQNGRFMLDVMLGPIHFGAGDEIDTDWQPTTGAFDYEMTLNEFQTYARDTFNAGDIFRFEMGAEWLALDPQSINWIDENTSRQQIAIKQAVTAVVAGDVLSFPAGYGDGRHFHYKNQTARLQKVITIDAAEDLPAPTVLGNEIWFEAEFAIGHSGGVSVWLDGVEWQKPNNQRFQTNGRIEFRDVAGAEVLWWLDFPRAWDSDGNAVMGEMEVRRQGGPGNLFVTVRIPKTWIDTAVFPIFIDPTIDVDVAASADDSRETSIGGTDETDTDFRMNVADEWVAARWAVPTITNADTIDAATVDWSCSNTNADEPGHDFLVEDVDSAAAYDGSSTDLSGRSYQTGVTWGDGSTVSVATNDDFFSTVTTLPDLATPVGATIGRAGWSPGNYLAVALLWTVTNGDVAVNMYDADSALAPALHIEYTAAGGGDPEGPLLGGKLAGGGILMGGRLVR